MQNGNVKFKIFTSEISDGNMSNKFGTESEVDENHRRFFEKHKINPHKVVEMIQVHGDRIGVVKRPQIRKNTDGLITKTSNLWLVVYHADCLPLFLIDEMTPALGVAHIGWQGTAHGITGKIVKEMVKHFKTDPKNLDVKFGPFICLKHYNVNINEERIKLLPSKIKNGRAYIDIYSPVRGQLIESGVAPSNIQNRLSIECTAEHPEKYWSHHVLRDKREGGMISVAGFID